MQSPTFRRPYIAVTAAIGVDAPAFFAHQASIDGLGCELRVLCRRCICLLFSTRKTTEPIGGGVGMVRICGSVRKFGQIPTKIEKSEF